MKLTSVIVAALMAACGALGAAHAADLEKGFMDTAWATPVSELPGLTKVGQSGKVVYYVKPDRVYRIFGTEVPEVVYGFFEEKLFAVYVDLEAIDAFTQIKRYIGQKYGLPKISRETRGDLTTYSWTVKDTRIKFKYAETYSRMKLGFYYLPIAGRLNSELKKELEDEPPEPIFPLSERRRKEAIEQMELLSF